MESTFKKQHESVRLPDGSLELRFKSNRLGAHRSEEAGAAIAIPLLIVAAVVGFGGAYLFNSPTFGGLLALVAVSVIFCKIFGQSTRTLVLRPDGIVFAGGKKQLAFRDIDDFGVMTETRSGRQYAETAYIYAEAMGQSIDLTGHMAKPLADLLLREILDFKG